MVMILCGSNCVG